MAMFLPIAEGGAEALAGGAEGAGGGAAAGAGGASSGGLGKMLNPMQFAKGLFGGGSKGGSGGQNSGGPDTPILGSSTDWERS